MSANIMNAEDADMTLRSRGVACSATGINCVPVAPPCSAESAAIASGSTLLEAVVAGCLGEK